MKINNFLIFIIVFLPPVRALIEWEIIIPTYNNQEWCIKNIRSLVNQTYTEWHATVIIDCATDNTESLLRSYITDHHLQNKIALIVNSENKGALYNIYHAVTACAPHKVIGLLDGDDWLAHNNVLEDLSKIYKKEDVWMTFGQFQLWPENRKGHCRPYRKATIKSNSFRFIKGRLPSHFRTFYAWLFQKIDLQDLLFEGNFFPVAWDIAMMFPMIEMAGHHHKCVSEVLYIYNIANPLNDFKLHTSLQAEYDALIRSKKRYKPLREKNE